MDNIDRDGSHERPAIDGKPVTPAANPVAGKYLEQQGYGSPCFNRTLSQFSGPSKPNHSVP
jgi:hypothetical protein